MRERATALVLLVVLVFYSATIGWRGVELIRDGRPAPVLLGIGAILVPLVAVLAMVPLVRMARDGQRMVAEANSAGHDAPESCGVWHAELEGAEACRPAGDRAGEQRHYRAAVRAWRSAQHERLDAPSREPEP